MPSHRPMSRQTRINWGVAATVFTGTLLAALSGIYFLFLPSGGYMGGRNPWYGVTILFDRHTWDDLHTWGGIAMIVAVVVHFILHWKWVVNMTKRLAQELTSRTSRMNSKARFNVIIDVVIGLSFLACAVSGLYFFVFPVAGAGWAATALVFSRATWDLIHTWSFVGLVLAAGIHIAIHWRWIVKVATNLIGTLGQGRPTKARAPQGVPQPVRVRSSF